MKQCYEGLGQTKEALAIRDQLLQQLPTYLLPNPDDARARGYYAVVLAEAGRKDDAMREGNHALELSPDDPVMLYNLCCLYSRLEEYPRAVETLRQAIAIGYANFAWMKHDPDIVRLRDRADYQELMAGKD